MLTDLPPELLARCQARWFHFKVDVSVLEETGERILGASGTRDGRAYELSIVIPDRPTGNDEAREALVAGLRASLVN